MEATGNDGRRGPSLPSSNHRGNQIGSNPYGNSVSSSSSGTIVSTTYTSHGSRLSSISMDAAVRHFELGLDDTECVQPIKKSCKDREERTNTTGIEKLVNKFFGAPSAEFSTNIINSNSGDMSVLERWFSELGVAWVLHLPDGASAGKLEHTFAASSWIRGFSRIVETIRGPKVQFLRGSLGQVAESDRQGSSNIDPDEIRLALFTKEAMSKMLPSVDIAIQQEVVSNNEMPSAQYKEAPYTAGRVRGFVPCT